MLHSYILTSYRTYLCMLLDKNLIVFWSVCSTYFHMEVVCDMVLLLHLLIFLSCEFILAVELHFKMSPFLCFGMGKVTVRTWVSIAWFQWDWKLSKLLQQVVSTNSILYLSLVVSLPEHDPAFFYPRKWPVLAEYHTITVLQLLGGSRNAK